MSYAFASVDEIKSPSQRRLVAEWDRLTNLQSLPQLSDFTNALRAQDPGQIVVWTVEGMGRLMQFRALYQGEAVGESFHDAWTGKTMSEVIPISLRRFAIEAAKECVAARLPVYTIVSTIDFSGQSVNCLRLLLPFGSGHRVEHLVACLQLSQTPDGVQRSRIVRNFEIESNLAFAATIKCEHPLPVASAGEIDNRRSARRPVNTAARISWGRRSKVCTVRNVSATGALLEGVGLEDVPAAFCLAFDMESTERPCAVVWRKKTQIGVRFD